jgi:ADP-glucose pyrophosphorylase
VIDDINLTTPADLLYCNLVLARSSPNGIVIGSNSALHEGVRIESSVIGKNVTVRHAISIRNSVVFDETDIGSETGFDNFIVTPTGMVDCNYGIQNGRNLWINNSRAYA